MRCTLQLVLSIAVMIATVHVAGAQSTDSPRAGDDHLAQTLRSMQEELQNLRRDNQAMREQMDELRAKADADWLTEARAEQIKGLVQDVLADADTRANLLNDGLMAGWSDHFFLADPFGRFLLQVEGMMQFRFVNNYRDQPDRLLNGFEVTRTRLAFRGHIFNDDLQYLVRGEFTPYPPQGTAAGVFYLLDSWLRYNLDNNWSVRAGQFKLPFNREFLISSAEQLAVERSLVNQHFALGRSEGVQLGYHDSANSWSIMLSNGLSSTGAVLAAIMGGPRTNTSAIAANVEYALTTRYERLLTGAWSQFNDFTSPIDDEFGMLFGGAIHVQKNESMTTQIVGDDEPWIFAATADYSVEWGGANAFVSATYHYIDTPGVPAGFGLQVLHMIGIVGQVGVYVAPKWELFARGEWAQLESAGGGTFKVPDMGVVTLGFNYYIEGHDVKWTSDIGFSLTEMFAGAGGWVSPLAGWRGVAQGNEPEIVFRTQIQILF